MHNYTILTKAEQHFFKQAIKHEKKKYIIVSILWNLFFATTNVVVFPTLSPHVLMNYVIGAILAFFTLIGIVLIIETIKKCNYWNIGAFSYRRAKILDKREEIKGSGREYHHYYFADVIMDNGEFIKDMHIQRNIYIMNQEDIVIARSEDEKYKYVFNTDAQVYAEIIPYVKYSEQ